uniref:Uncharacterized protein n=1 Tax=Lotharella globosa TaxID=91324 RepID=A0A7S3Z922_9EUKA|mmetsp:Transcript_38970/g.74828  ORF Transcript_38970/g.74828 Transcript_38970/m.74828 type:complete len:189 (+) Transcript_38970:67-633(+)
MVAWLAVPVANRGYYAVSYGFSAFAWRPTRHRDSGCLQASCIASEEKKLWEGCHPASMPAVPFFLTALAFTNYLKAMVKSYASILYFSSFGTECKMGLNSTRILRIRSRFSDGRDQASSTGYGNVELMGGDSQADLKSTLGPLLLLTARGQISIHFTTMMDLILAKESHLKTISSCVLVFREKKRRKT